MTRGDFYLGIDRSAKWIGSINHDAFPDKVSCDIITEVNPIMYEEKVLEFLRNDRPSSFIAQDGASWPWPWNDSNTTDYTYMFDFERGRVVASNFGGHFFDPLLIKQGVEFAAALLNIGLPTFPLMKMEIYRDGSYST